MLTEALADRIEADETRSFSAKDGNEISVNQGGQAGCVVPSEATAMVANVTAANQTFSEGKGNLVAFPFGGVEPISSLVNFDNGTNIANNAIVPLCTGGACAKDFSIKASFNGTHAVVDVSGYFAPKCGGGDDD